MVAITRLQNVKETSSMLCREDTHRRSRVRGWIIYSSGTPIVWTEGPVPWGQQERAISVTSDSASGDLAYQVCTIGTWGKFDSESGPTGPGQKFAFSAFFVPEEEQYKNQKQYREDYGSNYNSILLPSC